MALMAFCVRVRAPIPLPMPTSHMPGCRLLGHIANGGRVSCFAFYREKIQFFWHGAAQLTWHMALDRRPHNHDPPEASFTTPLTTQQITDPTAAARVCLTAWLACHGYAHMLLDVLGDVPVRQEVGVRVHKPIKRATTRPLVSCGPPNSAGQRQCMRGVPSSRTHM